MAAVAAVRGDSEVIEVGTHVECRAKNVDEVYYGATVVDFDVESSTYSVHYDDGTDDCGLRRSSMIVPSQQREVFSDEAIRIMDGHVWLRDKTLPARFLSFKSSPQLVQSAVVIDDSAGVNNNAAVCKAENAIAKIQAATEHGNQEDKRDTIFDHRTIVFDVDQALVLVLPIMQCSRFRSVKAADEVVSTPSQTRMCIVGAGAGCLAMCFWYYGPMVHIDVVELSADVVKVSQRWFGVPSVDPRLRFFIQDGLTFFDNDATCDASQGEVNRTLYDIIILDVADMRASDAKEGEEETLNIELPPEAFLTRLYLLGKVAPRLSDDGWVAINVIAGRAVLRRTVDDFSDWFPTVYVCAMDPNYAFFLSKKALEPGNAVASSDVVAWALACGFHSVAHAVLLEIQSTTSHFGRGVALGWFTADQFKELLDDPNVMI